MEMKVGNIYYNQAGNDFIYAWKLDGNDIFRDWDYNYFSVLGKIYDSEDELLKERFYNKLEKEITLLETKKLELEKLIEVNKDYKKVIIDKITEIVKWEVFTFKLNDLLSSEHLPKWVCEALVERYSNGMQKYIDLLTKEL